MIKRLFSEIILREDLFRSDHCGHVLQANYDFFWRMKDINMFLDEEMPRETVICQYLSEYIWQVNNGGHEQYASNCGWVQEDLDRIDEAFLAVGAEMHRKLFREIRDRVDADRELLAGMKKRGGFSDLGGGPVDAWLSEKDSEFFALNRENDIEELAANFLKSLDIVSAVPADQWQEALEYMIQFNPHYAERKAEKEKQELERKIFYERKIRLCEMLSSKIGREIRANVGYLVIANVDGEEIEAVIHKTEEGDEVAYMEHRGDAVVLSYPAGDELARVSLKL